jgi:aromatic-L-amino-acid/L-tryptophan decarboxylase
MTPEEFRTHGQAVIAWIADYLANPEQFDVIPRVGPGEVKNALPASAPEMSEAIPAILADFERILIPGTTHWNHPMFMAYFANTGSAAGVLGEALIAALNVNAMLWRTGPAATELEQVTLDWVRQMLGLPESFKGTITDTASASTLYALAAARELAPELRIRERGMAGRTDLPRLTIYQSEEAHSSVAKAVTTLGFGLDSLRSVPGDGNMRMDGDKLEEMIASDRASGARPLAIVATVGTTSTTAVDPLDRIAAIAKRESVWLHIDAAYAGAAAILPERRDILRGADGAHSLVVNPHKWLFTPMDCSILYTSRPDLLKRAFSITPSYLTETEPGEVINLMDYGVSLGRRFRALKLWFVLRHYGVAGLQKLLREHIRLASLFAGWVDADPDFELVTPVNFSTVVFRYRPRGTTPSELNSLNATIADRIHAGRELYLSHTSVRGQYCLRLAIGNEHTAESHVERAWAIIRQAARSDR